MISLHTYCISGNKVLHESVFGNPWSIHLIKCLCQSVFVEKLPNLMSTKFTIPTV